MLAPKSVAVLCAAVLVAGAVSLRLFSGEATPSGYPKKHPEERQELFDAILMVYRAMLPDGSEEFICRNGVRHLLQPMRRIVESNEKLACFTAGQWRGSPPDAAFPVIVTQDAQEAFPPLVFSVETGEVFPFEAY